MEGGGTLSDLYQKSKKLLLGTRDALERLERIDSSSFSSSSSYYSASLSHAVVDSPDLAQSIKKDIAQIQSLCVEMDRMWRSVGSRPQRDLWKRFRF